MLQSELNQVDTMAAAEDAHLIDLQWSALKMSEGKSIAQTAPASANRGSAEEQSWDLERHQSLANVMRRTSAPTWSYRRREAVERMEEAALHALTRVRFLCMCVSLDMSSVWLPQAFLKSYLPQRVMQASSAAISREEAIAAIGKGTRQVAHEVHLPQLKQTREIRGQERQDEAVLMAAMHEGLL
jgi:hypothetical protein